EAVAPRTFAMRLLVGVALVASALALVGVYGALSLSVGARTKEIAVRMAIGAQWHEVLRMVLGEGFRLIALGVLLGAIIAVSLGRVLETFLLQADTADRLPPTAQEPRRHHRGGAHARAWDHGDHGDVQRDLRGRAGSVSLQGRGQFDERQGLESR